MNIESLPLREQRELIDYFPNFDMAMKMKIRIGIRGMVQRLYGNDRVFITPNNTLYPSDMKATKTLDFNRINFQNEYYRIITKIASDYRMDIYCNNVKEREMYSKVRSFLTQIMDMPSNSFEKMRDIIDYIDNYINLLANTISDQSFTRKIALLILGTILPFKLHGVSISLNISMSNNSNAPILSSFAKKSDYLLNMIKKISILADEMDKMNVSYSNKYKQYVNSIYLLLTSLGYDESRSYSLFEIAIDEKIHGQLDKLFSDKNTNFFKLMGNFDDKDFSNSIDSSDSTLYMTDNMIENNHKDTIAVNVAGRYSRFIFGDNIVPQHATVNNLITSVDSIDLKEIQKYIPYCKSFSYNISEQQMCFIKHELNPDKICNISDPYSHYNGKTIIEIAGMLYLLISVNEDSLLRGISIHKMNDGSRNVIEITINPNDKYELCFQTNRKDVV